MAMFARIIGALSLIFVAFFITFLILMWQFPGRSFATVFLSPSVCPGSCALGGGPGSLLLSDQQLINIGIRYEWPEQMNLNSSDSIIVQLAFASSETMAYRSTPNPGGNHQVAEATPPIGGLGTPSVKINGTPTNTLVAQAFGPGYQTSASAQLLTNTFDIKTFQPTEQSLDQEVISWVWNVKPTSLGPQVINLDVDFIWRPTGKGQVIERQIWQTQITINVTQPFLDPGQLSIGTTISGTLAAGGLITAIATAFVTSALDRFWKKGGEEGKTDQQKSEKENKTGENRQQDDRVGEAQVQEAESSVQLQQRSRAQSLDIWTLLQRRSRAQSLGLKALFIMLALLIIGGGALIYYTRVLRPAQLSAQATAAVTHATATADFQLTATATSAQHLLTASTTGSTALNDSLSDNSGNYGWVKSATCKFSGGGYHAISKKENYIYYCLALSTTFADFVYQVQLSINPGSAGCLILRYRGSSNTISFDGFCVDGYEGYSFIIKAASETTYRSLKSGYAAIPKSGANAKNATNTVTVIAQGPQYTMYINNQYVLTMTDHTTSQGAIGVGAIDEFGNSKGADVTFSNAKVWRNY